jgi:hypothetical protein
MIGYYSDKPNSQEIPAGFNLLFPDATNQINANQKRGDFITNVANASSSALGLLFSTTAQQYVPGLKVISLVVPGNGTIAPDLLRSDHAPFWFAGKPALMLTDGANFRNECYHTPSDTLDGKLSFTFMSNVVKATVVAAAQLAGLQHGDWATATFEGTVGAPEAAGCQFEIRHAGGSSDVLYISANQCVIDEAQVKVIDERGVLLHAGQIDLGRAERAGAIALPPLSSGMYFATIAWPGGMHTHKFAIGR